MAVVVLLHAVSVLGATGYPAHGLARGAVGRARIVASAGFGKSASAGRKSPPKADAKKATPAAAAVEDDYAVFPPLAPAVRATLEPASTSDASQLPSRETMDAIGALYGFPDLNAGATDRGSPAFPGLRLAHRDPAVFVIDDFFSAAECARYIALSDRADETPSAASASAHASPVKAQSKTVGADAQARAQRTSTTWFHHYEAVPEFLSKACALFGIPTALPDLQRLEEPQTVRYRPGEKFTWHLDALAPSDTLAERGGQRAATLLVYLNDMDARLGGATRFRDLVGADGLQLAIQPKRGMALLFFPAACGLPNSPFDLRTLHAGQSVALQQPAAAAVDKWIAQMWVRELAQYSPTVPPGSTHARGVASIQAFRETSR